MKPSTGLKRKTPMKRTPLERKTPIKRKRTTKRKPTYRTPRCTWETPSGRRTCTNPQRVLDLCRKHAMLTGDHLAGNYVKQRDRKCVSCGTTEGALTWAHIIRRNEGRWIRHAPYNAVALCWSPCHYRFTHHEADWQDFIDAHFGRDRHPRLRAIRNKREYDNPALERTLLRYGYETKDAP